MNIRYLKEDRKTDSRDKFAFIVDEKGHKSVFLNGARLKCVSNVKINGNGARDATSVEINLLV
ncbi:hypothetical protein RAZ24_002572 [Listeria monocytogenes]|uniref:hypothetical protein n=1 Tax=Listeria monocytogenes TaxID=1639 RepID=UPI000E6C8042|nr:hypothetical protein [Listeria monocytogenes]EAC7071892.1 hypothetical protein [Listeria monocytogenes]EAD8310222.1 hypothetical protein [Listeria monocytogenes]EEO6745589.1 hypothetical protein [Listeria monocytogenes]EGO6802909.1 hypothetical protein [Listeria monocytogenes]EGO6843241.1 hypothetical protein [Listeria monocytogenes]